MRGSAVRTLTCTLGLLLGASPGVRADVLEPLNFSALAPALAPTAPATIAINTGDNAACTPAGPSLIVNGGVPFCGAVDDQGGAADYLAGVWLPGSQGIPEIAVFSFGSIDLASGVVVSVSGTRALALLSQSHATINTTIAVNGTLGLDGAAGSGGSGGQRGGLGTGNGEGLGAGVGGACPQSGCGAGAAIGSAGFGSPAYPGGPTPATGGAAYGDLTGFLQGGSGGGGVLNSATARGGGGGGGALEIGAVTTLTIGVSASLEARGRRGTFSPTFVGRNAGLGSGGGARLHAGTLVLVGSVDADVAETTRSATLTIPGGGRALLHGVPGPFVVGSSTPVVPAMASLVNTRGGVGFGSLFGTIQLAPGLTIVPPLQVLDLAAAAVELQAPTEFVPRILFHQAGDLWLLSGAEVSVPANFRTSRELRLGSPSSLVGGAGPLTNLNVIRGGGEIAVTLENADTGQIRVGSGERLELGALANTNDGAIEVIGGTLVSAQALTNQTGGRLDAIHAALDFAGSGLANFGTLDLIETSVSGAVANALGATIGVAGTATFAGLVSGAGAFAGDDGTVIFAGGFAPGDSAAIVAFDGSASFGGGNTLSVEIGGLTAGTEHDRVDIGGTATLDGTLALSLISGFTPTPGQSVTLLTHGARVGEFAAVAGVQQAGLLDLALHYGAGSTTLTAAARGDVNLDGSVDATDVAIVQGNQGAGTTAYGAGDVDGDGSVDAVDLDIVQSAAGPAIPVLAPVGLLALALLLLATVLARARNAALRRLLAVVLAAGALAAPPRAAADVLDPLAFDSLGPSLTLPSGSLVINTGDAAACGGPSLVVNGGTAVCGVVDDQGGTADYLGGVWVPGSQGVPEIAVFTFDEIDLPSGVGVTVTGTRALALLSRGDASINTTIALDATPVTVGVAGSPGPGGFRGGLGTESGHGPGGGTGGTSGLSWIGSGGFGASATEIGGGPAYGDLSQVLQGGSGGGGLSYPTDPPTPLLGGGGGGGALEVGARGLLILGPNGRLRAEGTTGAVVNTLGGGYAAPGSGGGIRAHGHPLLLQPGAQILADVSPGLGVNWSPTFSYSAGGRVLIEGRLLQFTVGDSASASALSAGIDTSGSNGSPWGVIDATPDLTLVPSGQSLDLALVPVVLQTQQSTVPEVRLRYRNLRVAPGATVSVPANHRNRGDLWLDSRTDPPTDPPTARVIGSGPLVNERTIHGSGTIEVTLQNAAGATLSAGKSDLLRLDGPANTNAGEIDLIGGTLRFTTALSNDAGGELNLIDATLDCASPLGGAGALHAISSTQSVACTPPGP